LTLTYESYTFGLRERRYTKKKRFATPTILLTTIGYIKNGAWYSAEGQILPVGTKLRISGTLYTSGYVFVPPGRPIKIYVMVPGSASYTLLTTVNTISPSNFHYEYVLGSMGNYKFYCKFEGDDEYEGCP